jgi:hypothetical protein
MERGHLARIMGRGLLACSYEYRGLEVRGH